MAKLLTAGLTLPHTHNVYIVKQPLTNIVLLTYLLPLATAVHQDLPPVLTAKAK